MIIYRMKGIYVFMKKTSELESSISRTEKYKMLYVHYGVEELKTKIQPALLRMLVDFDEICRKNNIYYVITAGTLLGAIREKGFIAWDDDIDVLVLPDAYGHIKEAVDKSGLADKYTLITPEESEQVAVAARFINKEVTLGTLTGNPKIGHPLYIDVLTIENVPNNWLLRNIKGICSTVLFLSYTSLRCLNSKDELLNIMAKDFKALKRNLLIRKIAAIPAIILGQRRMYKMLVRVSRHSNNKTKYVTVPLGVCKYKGEIQPREVFEEAILVEFENLDFPAPKGYLSYLENRYGCDYMTPPPESERGIMCFKKRDDWKEILDR